MNELKFLKGQYTSYTGLTSKDENSFYVTMDDSRGYELWLGAQPIAAGKTLESLNNEITRATGVEKGLNDRLAALEGTGTGSIADQIKDAIEALNAEKEGTSADGFVTVKVTEVAGKLNTVVVTTNDIAKASELDALEAAVGEGFSAEATVSAAIAANKKAIEDEADRALKAEGELDVRLDVIEGEGDGSIKKAVADAKAALEGTFKNGDAQTLAALNTKIEKVSSDAKSYEVVAVTEGLEANVREAYKLVDEDGTQVGATIKVYKDSALKEVKLEEQTLKFTYIKVDGTEETVGVDVSKFLSETEFKDGLDVVGGVVSVNVGEDTESNKNFLDMEADGDGNKALAVRSIDTDSTVTTDRILVAGGPLDSTALRGILPKDESGNAYIEAGTDVQSLLLSLFTKVEWPTPTVTEGKINTTIAAPSFTLKNGTTDASNQTYEVGTVLTMSDVTLSAVSNTTTARTCSEFTYGYSDAVDGVITKTKTISIDATNITVNGDNYTMSRDFTTFTNADDSATPSTTASEVTLDGADCVLQEGECKVKVSISGPKGECTFAEMPSYFVTSNVGTLSDEHKSPTQTEATVKEDTTPTNSKEIKVNGRYKYYVGYSTNTAYSQFDSAAIKALAAKKGDITVNSTTTILNDTTKLTSNGTSIVVACPAKYKLATITNGVGADILANFSSVGKVSYTNGSVTTEYMVYVYPITNGATVEFKNVTLTKA
mgnify:CR=1 FL=1